MGLFTAMLAGVILAQPPIIIAHRGASGVRPEHTLEAYELAIEQGADYIEPDVVITKDGVLIARHENELSLTTNVSDIPELAGLKTTKRIDGQNVTGWFSEDLTLDQIKLLRAKEARPQLRPESAKFDGQFQIPTFEEVVELAANRGVGIYPETKHPKYFQDLKLPLEKPLVAILNKHKLNTAESRVFIQSFEVNNLKELRKMTSLPLVQLIDASGGPFDQPNRTYAQMITPEGLKEIATYAQGIGVTKSLVIPRVGGNLGEPTSLVKDAQSAGLKVHVWTFRNENPFLPNNLQGNPEEELRRFVAAGIDGFFTDFVDTAVKVVRGSDN